MKYEKIRAQVVCFDQNKLFMAWSGGPGGQAKAEAAAVGQPAIQEELAKGTRSHIENSSYDPVTGYWTVTVHCYNNGGHQTLERTYVFDSNGNLVG